MIGRRVDDAHAFDEAWSDRASHRSAPRSEQIAQLVRFAETLCEAAVAEPTPEFRLGLRSTLMAEAKTSLVPVKVSPRTITPPAPHPVRRRVAGVTAAVLASAGVVGLVSSSASAVPGEMLYPVKRSVESMQLALHQGDDSRGSFELAQASERLAEARELSDNPSARTDALLADTLDDFSSQAESGSSSLFDEFGDNGKEKSVQKVSDFAAAAATELATLSSVLPDTAQESFAAAAKTVGDIAVQASTLCSTCSSADAQSLVNAVTALTQAEAADDTTPATSEQPGATQAPALPGVTGSTTAPVSTVPQVTLPPIDLSPVTDPLLGENGLVPGLLNGLLGGNK